MRGYTCHPFKIPSHPIPSPSTPYPQSHTHSNPQSVPNPNPIPSQIPNPKSQIPIPIPYIILASVKFFRPELNNWHRNFLFWKLRVTKISDFSKFFWEQNFIFGFCVISHDMSRDHRVYGI